MCQPYVLRRIAQRSWFSVCPREHWQSASTILLAIFKDYISEKEAKKGNKAEDKRTYFRLSATKQREYIDTIFQKDIKFKSQLLGMIIGHFDLEEYNLYAQNKIGTDRRIINLLKERIFNGLAELPQEF